VEGQVPGRDQPGDAAGLAQDVVERDRVGAVALRGGVQDGGGEEAEVASGPGDVHVPGQAKRLAGVDRLRAGQFGGPGVDAVGQGQQQARALGGGRARPGGEGPPGGLGGRLHVAAVAVGHAGDYLARRRSHLVEVLARRRGDVPAVDVVGQRVHDAHYTNGAG